MGQRQIINGYKVKNFCSMFFSNYKKIIFLLFLIMVLGIFTGALTINKFGGNINLGNMPDKQLGRFLTGSGLWGVFFITLFYTICLMGMVMFLNFKRWLIPISLLILLYKSYMLGSDIAVMIMLFGVMGTINLFLFIVPFDLMVLLLFIVLIALSIKKVLIATKYGSNKNNIYCEINYSLAYLVLVVSVVVVMLLKTFFMPIIKVTIIVS